MKHIVEFFDGRKIRGLLVDQHSLSDFLSRVEKLDPALGAIVLDITPEKSWQANKRQSSSQWGQSSGIDPQRHRRVDQFIV